MNITIIGNGNMAKGIGTRLVNGGHAVTIHAKDQAKGNALVEELTGINSAVDIKSRTVGSETDEIVILAVPYLEIESVAQKYNSFDGKIVVDITNPVDFNTFQLIPEPGNSGAQEIAKLMPGARVVKAFNTNFAGTLLAGRVDEKTLDVLIAGDDVAAKKMICELVASSDMRPIDVGPLANARHLEGFGLIQMTIQDQIGTNWMSGLKFVG